MAPTSGNPKVWKKEPTPPPPPRKRFRPPEREEKEECLPCDLPVRKEPGAEGSTSGEEEEERALPLSRDLDTARLEEMREDCCT